MALSADALEATHSITDPKYLELSNAATPEQTLKDIHDLLRGEQTVSERAHLSQRLKFLDILAKTTVLANETEDSLVGIDYLVVGQTPTEEIQDVINGIEPLNERLRVVRVRDLGSNREIGQRAPVLDR